MTAASGIGNQRSRITRVTNVCSQSTRIASIDKPAETNDQSINRDMATEADETDVIQAYEHSAAKFLGAPARNSLRKDTKYKQPERHV